MTAPKTNRKGAHHARLFCCGVAAFGESLVRIKKPNPLLQYKEFRACMGISPINCFYHDD
jgi:hypothetical protein